MMASEVAGCRSSARGYGCPPPASHAPASREKELVRLARNLGHRPHPVAAAPFGAAPAPPPQRRAQVSLPGCRPAQPRPGHGPAHAAVPEHGARDSLGRRRPRNLRLQDPCPNGRRHADSRQRDAAAVSFGHPPRSRRPPSPGVAPGNRHVCLESGFSSVAA
jgi:hypothetical protein